MDKEHFLGELKQDVELGKFIGIQSKASKGKRAKGRTLPAELSVDNMRSFLPAVSGCYPFYEKGCERLRCFYKTKAGVRASASFSVMEHGISAAARQCLTWAWTMHSAQTQQQCDIIDLV